VKEMSGCVEERVGSSLCFLRCSLDIRTYLSFGGGNVTFLNICECKDLERSCTPTSFRFAATLLVRDTFQHFKRCSHRISDSCFVQGIPPAPCAALARQRCSVHLGVDLKLFLQFFL